MFQGLKSSQLETYDWNPACVSLTGQENPLASALPKASFLEKDCDLLAISLWMQSKPLVP